MLYLDLILSAKSANKDVKLIMINIGINSFVCIKDTKNPMKPAMVNSVTPITEFAIPLSFLKYSRAVAIPLPKMIPKIPTYIVIKNVTAIRFTEVDAKRERLIPAINWINSPTFKILFGSNCSTSFMFKRVNKIITKTLSPNKKGKSCLLTPKYSI